MADAISRADHEEALNFAQRMARRAGVHEHTIRQGAMQFASGVESIAGGAIAAGLDYFLGTPDAGGSPIPELTVGLVPLGPVIGLLAKLGAIGLHVSAKGKAGSDADVAASHLGNLADGVLAGSTSLGLMRLLLTMKPPQVFKQA